MLQAKVIRTAILVTLPTWKKSFLHCISFKHFLKIVSFLAVNLVFSGWANRAHICTVSTTSV